MKWNGWKQLLILILVCTSMGGWTQDVPSGSKSQSSGNEDDVDYSVFSLEELFKVNVITASKQVEPLWDAGGVVTVLNRQEIEKFGGNNLWDLVERLPSVQKNFSTGVNSTSIRGGEGISQSHLLLLIDGRPFRSSNGNLSIYNAWATFPLDSIERIEIVRGPGSVLYGTNAFEGVLNVITRKGKRNNSISVNSKMGSFKTRSVDVAAHYRKGDFKLDGGTYFFKTDGWDFESGSLLNGQPLLDENGSIVKFKQGVFEDNKGIKLAAGYKGLAFSVYDGELERFSEVFFNGDDVYYKSRASMYNLSYEQSLTKQWQLEVNLTNNKEKFKFLFKGVETPAVAINSDDLLLETTLSGEINEKLRLMFGVVWQQWDGENPPSIFGTASNYDIEEQLGAYSQITYRPNRYIKLIGGFQLNKPDAAKADIVPRLGLIWNYSPRVGVKLLYGQAFKSPIPQERYINIEGFQLGYPDLKSERITTYSGQLFFQGENQLHVLTLFTSKEEDLIRLIAPVDSDYEDFRGHFNLTRAQFLNYQLITRNQGELNVKGVEFENKFTIGLNWYFMSALSYQKNKNQDGVQDVTLAPNKLLKGGVGYSKEKLHGSLFIAHYDKTKDNVLVNPTRILLNPPAKAFNSTNLSMGYDWRGGKNTYALQLSIQNLLNEKVYVHQLPEETINTVPGRGERSYFVNLRYKK